MTLLKASPSLITTYFGRNRAKDEEFLEKHLKGLGGRADSIQWGNPRWSRRYATGPSREKLSDWKKYA